MNSYKKFAIVIFVSASSILLPSIVKAEPKITSTPPNISIAEQKCWLGEFFCPKVRRNLFLRSNQVVKDVKILSLDLNRADGTEVFPANAIKVNLETSKINSLPNQPLLTPIEFDLKGVKSGEYNGNLLVITPESELVIPISIKVKDYWFLPLLVLLLGVGLGIVISTYRNEWMARDEVVIQAARLRSRIRADEEFKQDISFYKKAEAYLASIEVALENKRSSAAQETANKAQDLWDKWHQSKQSWLSLLEYEAKLRKRVEEQNPGNQIPYLEQVMWQLDSINKDRPSQDSPSQVNKALQEVQIQINNYILAETQLDEFRELTNQVPYSAPEKERFWKNEALRLERLLHNLSPTDLESYRKWQDDIKRETEELVGDIEKLNNNLSKPETKGFLGEKSREIQNPTHANLLEPVPDIFSDQIDVDTNQVEKLSRHRLLVFNSFSYIIAIFLLGNAGFTQLYLANNTFGTRGVIDYFSLLAWGFGAEATRETVTRVLQEWKLPGLSK
ncbi:MAG: hypothetical protein IGS39_09355 [Calothrix sp. C42_A2020_038]|nr:hypothetical protein [Calothrix sp. C42_A2020_038]